jgi:hypothetical protein
VKIVPAMITAGDNNFKYIINMPGTFSQIHIQYVFAVKGR